MQKIQSPPKPSAITAQLLIEEEQIELISQNFMPGSVDDFKSALLMTTTHYETLANTVKDTSLVEKLTQALTGIQYSFNVIQTNSSSFIQLSQYHLSVLNQAQLELAQNSKIQHQQALTQDLQTAQNFLTGLQNWVTQNQPSANSAVPQNSTSPQNSAVPQSVTITPTISTMVTSTDPFQNLINNLNTDTVASFLTALQNLNQYISNTPTFSITTQQFTVLFNQLDQTFQRLPEVVGSGLPQRQVIAGMISVNQQVNILYGYLMSQQKTSV